MRKSTSSPILSNQKGIALLMVMGSIALMTYVIADFSFETHVNKLRVYNITDQQQARLTSEAGLNIALAKMKLYQNARNMLAKNESLQKSMDVSVLERAVTTPDLVFPIPQMENQMDQKALSAVQDFNSESLLQGQLSLTITPVRGFLNPNHMRVSAAINQKKKEDKEGEDRDQQDRSGRREEDDETAPYLYIEKKLTETLKESMREKREESDRFNALYGNKRADLLIKELKYFITHPDNFKDAEKSEIESLYLNKEITPKHAPLTSIDEMYLLAGWDDEIVDLIKDQLTVHESSVIQVNEITEKQLEILFPEITDFQVEEFFEYRDGNPEKELEPHEFKSAKDFKQVMVKRLGVISSSRYDERIKAFESAGMSIGVAGKLFKVTSKAKYNRATYTITAYIDIPIKPEPPKKEDEEQQDQPNEANRDFQQNPDQQNNGQDRANQSQDRDEDEEEEDKPPEFLPPRIVEIRRT